ncbi:MAG: hypothetical protein GY782_03570 [Gammaproteobacteria bacterium]|nr:hypothetical protein [Gammaproteobacteria bacterium]
MSNSFAHDKMCTLWEEVAETTGMRMALSKDLNTYNMSDMANKDQTGDGNDTNYGTGSDREYIPQDYRFEAKDGIVTTDSDFQNVVDRMIPVNRGLSFNIPASVKAKELGNPSRLTEIAKGFARDIANKIDTTCYQKMINQSTMFVGVDSKFDFTAGIDAETLLLNRGLSAYDRKLFLSNKHYSSVAKELGQMSREVFTADALSRAQIPDLATFNTMRSDYLINVAGNGTTGLTVNGNQSHTVATYDNEGFYLDNRSMSLAITGATAGKLPVGTKFTIAGVNAVHPETRTDTGELMTFTVLEGGAGTAKIQPAIVKDGPYQNVTAQAADSAAITILNAKGDAPSLFYTPESTVIVPGRVPVIGDGVKTQTLTTENGIPMTMVYWYDGHKMQYNMKAVVNFDVQVVYPEMLGAIYANQA